MPRTRSLLPALVLATALLGPAGASAASPGCHGAHLRPTRADVAQVRHATLCLLNRERARHGLRPLRQHRALRGVAKRYSRLMVRKRFFAHVSPAGSTMVARVKRSSYLRGARGFMLGENIAWGSGRRATPLGTVRAWMRSPGHRANILNPRFHEVGIGISLGAPVHRSGGGGSATYTTDFGRRG